MFRYWLWYTFEYRNGLKLRTSRVNIISLKDKRYINLLRIEEIDKDLKNQGDLLSENCIKFLLKPEALKPYAKKVEEIKKEVESLKKVTAASHNEVGRLLEEHGFIGLLLLIILTTIPLFNFFRSTNYQRAFIMSFYVFWFLTINHSAMRIALPGFIYGLSLIHITGNEEE